MLKVFIVGILFTDSLSLHSTNYTIATVSIMNEGPVDREAQLNLENRKNVKE